MIENVGKIAPRGDLELKVIRGNRLGPAVLRGRRPGNIKAATLADLIRMALRDGLPSMDQPLALRAWKVRNMKNLWRGFKRIAIARQCGIATMVGDLRLVKIFGPGDPLYAGMRIDFGLVSLRVVTNNGVAFIVDAFDNTVEAEIMNYHGIGTGTNAENVADSALQTELTTEYTGNQRATGTQTQPSANIYRTTGTNTLDSGTPAVTEHGVLSQQATGGGVLLDRSVFAAINLTGANGDGLQSQYSLTLTAGS